MKNFLVSGLVKEYRIKTNIFALSPKSAVKVFQQKYPEAKDVYVIQNLFKRKIFKSQCLKTKKLKIAKGMEYGLG